MKREFSFDYKVPQDQIRKPLYNLEIHITIKVDCVGQIENGEPKVKVTGLHFNDTDLIYLKDNVWTAVEIEKQAEVEYNNRFNNAFPKDLNVVQMAEEYSIVNLKPEQKHLN